MQSAGVQEQQRATVATTMQESIQNVCLVPISWKEAALMAESYHTFIIQIYQTPYKKMTVKLTCRAK